MGTPGNARAPRRVVVAATGVKKVYSRQAREIWELTPAHLDRQLVSAEFRATEVSRPTERTAR